ncbi:MAG: hypothetical protein ACE5EY_13700 [Anaerolineae bacterium]
MSDLENNLPDETNPEITEYPGTENPEELPIELKQEEELDQEVETLAETEEDSEESFEADLEDEGEEEEEEEEKKRRLLLLLLLLLLLMLCCLCGLFYKYVRQPAPLPELVVPQAEINYPPHYLFSIYGLDRPVGVALSPSGDRIYVSESAGERLVKIFDRDGNPLGSFAPPRTYSGERSPVYMDTDSNGRLYVADRSQHAIMMYDADGNYKDTLLTPDLSLSEYVSQHTGGLQLGASFEFNIFQENVIYKVRDGDEQALPAPPTAAIWSPLGITIDDNNQLLVTDVADDQNNVREFVINDDSTLLAWHQVNENVPIFGATGQGNGEFLYPNAAVADSQGRIYVSDGNNGRVSVWDGAGNFLFHFGSGSGDGALSLPRGAAMDQRDRLYVIDAVGQDIKVYDITGDEPVFLYTFGEFGLEDGMS